MKYKISNLDYINTYCGKEYLFEHVIKSLDKEFENDGHDLEDVMTENDLGELHPITVLRINDLSDDDCMLEFKVLWIENDNYVVEFLGRVKF